MGGGTPYGQCPIHTGLRQCQGSAVSPVAPYDEKRRDAVLHEEGFDGGEVEASSGGAEDGPPRVVHRADSFQGQGHDGVLCVVEAVIAVCNTNHTLHAILQDEGASHLPHNIVQARAQPTTRDDGSGGCGGVLVQSATGASTDIGTRDTAVFWLAHNVCDDDILLRNEVLRKRSDPDISSGKYASLRSPGSCWGEGEMHPLRASMYATMEHPYAIHGQVHVCAWRDFSEKMRKMREAHHTYCGISVWADSSNVRPSPRLSHGRLSWTIVSFIRGFVAPFGKEGLFPSLDRSS